MLKKRVLLVLCSILLTVIILLGVTLNFIEPLFYVKFTGMAVESGALSLTGNEIEILNPQNITYFLKDKDNYFIRLNVSANFNVERWEYDLIDEQGNMVRENMLFVPGLPVEVLRWNNRINIKATDELGGVTEESVEFFISVPDSFPMIENLESPIYVCEGDKLNYTFSVKDPDENKNIGPIQIKLEPQELFYVNPEETYPSTGERTTNFSIVSKALTKEDAGGIDKTSKSYDVKINVNDGMYFSFNRTSIVVVGKNNAPKIQKIGVKTEVIKWKGDNTLNYKAEVSDIEDGDGDSGNFKFDISFEGKELFGINSNGLMTLDFDESHVGVYNVTVCVSDTGIERPHVKIPEVCRQTGSDQTSCTNFSLTITEENNAPTITEYSPKKLSVEIEEGEIYFNVSVFDPDKNAPDVYWYIDDKLVSYTPGSELIKGFSGIKHSFGCDAGIHPVNARITDGLLNDTVEWRVKVEPKPGCEEPPKCLEEWVCEKWMTCQNLQKTLASGILSQEDYRIIQDECVSNKWSSENCGFRIRECFDLSNCNTSFIEPKKIERCYYNENPNCEDGIKNCHSRDCEILTDCGGPCKPCPTCYDGIQNQGEENIDCGGPCYLQCRAKESPFVYVGGSLRYVMIGLIVVLFIIIVFKIMRISELKKQIKKEEQSYRW